MANFGDITSNVSIGAGQSVRRNAGDTAFEAYTPSAGSGVSDGDYGDITVSGGGATWTIDNGAVTLAKQADMATGSVVYRKTAGTGVPEVQTLATLKTDLTLVKGDVGLGNVDNTSDVNKPVSTATQTALDLKVDENVAITGATKTKVTYDAKGLVTAGADATTADIADSSNKRYVTDAQQTVIGNTSGTNTGDQTSIVGITGTKAQFDTAVTDGNILFVGDVTQYTDEMAQDATGAMVANSTFVSLAYNDATPSLTPSLSATGTPSASTYLRGDNTWASIAGGGDVTGQASSVDSEIAIFSGTTGKVIKRATNTGILKASSGVIATATSGTDYAPATSGTSMLKGNGSGGFSSATPITDYLPGYTVVATLASDQATGANTTPVTLSGLVFTYEANSKYLIECMALVQPTAATTGCGFQFDLSSAVTSIWVQFYHQLANTGTLSGGHSIADDASVGVSSGMPGTSTYPVRVHGLLITTSNTGTAQFRFRSETTAVTTCKAGTTLIVRKIA